MESFPCSAEGHAGADILAPLEPAAPIEVAAEITSLLAPPVADDPPPPWLRPEQRDPFGRLLAAVRSYHGALLALPVGAGKTYVSAAVALALAEPESIEVVAPAILERQWRIVLESIGVTVRITGHEAVSRGRRLGPGRVVIIDECHRFREPGTRRYRVLAPDLIGRRVILVTATPVVNRLTDLAAQLALGVADDALQPWGAASIRQALAGGTVPANLDRVVVAGERLGIGAPARDARSIPDWSLGDRFVARLVRRVDALRLARSPAVAGLIRGSLYRALTSSPAAFLGALIRYQRLLAHAVDAHQAGHALNRAVIRSTIAADPDQMLLWDLLPQEAAPADLALGDRRAVERLIAEARQWLERPDPKLDRLNGLLADGAGAVVFCGSLDTVGYLRNRVRAKGVAWITGHGAGFAGARVSRSAVLRSFDPAATEPGMAGARILIASDVAAEGLNLQRIGRVIHYDLPWTAVRLAQRDGRAVRLGSTHSTVVIHRFEVPPGLDARLGLMTALATKAALPVRIGLAADTESALLRGVRLAARFRAVEPRPGWARWRGPPIAGYRLVAGGRRVAGLVLVRNRSGHWVDDPELACRELSRSRDDPAGIESAADPGSLLESLDAASAAMVASRNGAALVGAVLPAGTRHPIADRLAISWNRRDPTGLDELEAVYRFLRRGHTAGEALLASGLAEGGRQAFEAAVARGRATTPPEPVTATPVGLLIGSLDPIPGPD